MKITDISGTVTLNNGVKMPYLGLGVFKVKDGDEVKKTIHYALDAGYRHLDTAAFYENEEGVGKAIASHDVNREDIFVTSKVWNTEQGYDSTLKAFDTSLKKLGFDYLDLYLIHWPVAGKFIETWRALEKIYQDGRVRAIGVSNFLQHHLQTLFDNSETRPAVNQTEFHPRLVQQSLIDFCVQNKVQFEAWSPFRMGEIFTVRELDEIAAKYNKTVAQLVIRWDLQKGVVTIPKSVKKERIITNAQVFDFEISAEDMLLIDSLDRHERIGSDPDNFNF
jgi:diketogulonate reductase-like aldo/keto reductase